MCPSTCCASSGPTTALDAIEQRKATVFIGVPAMYRMMAEAGAETRDLSSVRLWASGADAMPFELAKKFQRLGASATLPVVGKSVGEAMFVDGYGMVELGGRCGASRCSRRCSRCRARSPSPCPASR